MSDILFNEPLGSENDEELAQNESRSDDSISSNNIKVPKPKSKSVNIFMSSAESNTPNSSFPDWDILPANQFINPRIQKS